MYIDLPVRLTVCKKTVKFVPVDLSKSYVDRSVYRYEQKYLMSMSYLQSKPYLFLTKSGTSGRNSYM